MKAIVQDRYGSPDMLALKDIEAPVAPADRVLVRVQAAGVDPGVWHLMAGRPYLVRAATGLRRPTSPVRGLDVAGRVEAVGAAVTGLRPGDPVFGVADGSFAELAVARPDRLAAMPAKLSFAEAAVVPISGCTALQALRDRGRVRAGQRVLIIGAAGGVGSFAVQLAKAFGAEVTAVCRGANANLVRSLGADDVIDYTRSPDLTGAHPYDLVIDTAGNRPLSTLRRLLTPRGALVIVGGEGGGRWLGGIDRQLRAVLLTPFVGQTLGSLLAVVRTDDLQVLRGLIEAGSVRPVVDAAFPLADAAAAVRRVHDGHGRGKVVLSLGE